MTDVLTGMPPAAWYPDPAEPQLLRWWSGTSWSTHVMTKAESDAIDRQNAVSATAAPAPSPAPTPAPASAPTPAPTFSIPDPFAPVAPPVAPVAPIAPMTPMTSVPETTLSVPPVLHKVPSGALPEPMPFASGVALGADSPNLRSSDAPMLSPIERAARAEIYAKLARSSEAETAVARSNDNFGSLGTVTRTSPTSWNTMPTAPMPGNRTGTSGGWLLAFYPWFLIGLYAVILQLAVNIPQAFPVGAYVAIGVFWLFPFMLASLDRSGLRERGYSEPPSGWWMLLGPMVYLIVRTIKLSSQGGRAAAILVAYFVNVVLVVGGATAVIFLLAFQVPSFL